MKTTVIIVRHCEAEGNIKRFFQGHTDGQISERGAAQLKLLSERLRGTAIDAIYSSPLSRAMATAQAVNDGRNLPIITDPRLIEINGGALEGMPWGELPEKYPELAAEWNLRPWDFAAPEGESMRRVYNRISSAVLDIASQNCGKTIAIASHGCAIRCLMCWAKKLPIEKLNDIDWCDNTSVNIIEFDEKFNPTVVCENDRSHLEYGMSAMDSQTWWRAENRDKMDFSN
ncbi:MAG: histidine phosphatase family protein [Acutalibacteraceae bacterium]